MTIDGPWAGDPVPISDELTQHYRDTLAAHTDDALLGACPYCKVTLCPDYRWAATQLHLAGLPNTRTGDLRTRP